MLRGIPSLVSPELLKVLAEMGHGDDLVIGDLNFPAASMANRLVRLDGHGVAQTLEAILSLVPLDDFVPSSVHLMEVVGGAAQPLAHTLIRNLVAAWDPRPSAVDTLERFAFYERARRAYAIVATGEPLLYGCVIVTKGVFRASPPAEA